MILRKENLLRIRKKKKIVYTRVRKGKTQFEYYNSIKGVIVRRSSSTAAVVSR